VQALGDEQFGAIPNNYRLVREAIDRGVPLEDVKKGNNITVQLKKLIAPLPADKAAAPASTKKLNLSWAK
jgi:pilus assembly protein CpaE